MDWKTATAISVACEFFFCFQKFPKAIFGIKAADFFFFFLSLLSRSPTSTSSTSTSSLILSFSSPKKKSSDVGGVLGGKRLMKHRKPFNVKPFAVVHNAVMFALSLYMVIETLTQSYENFGWAKKFTPWGNMVENPGSAKFSPSGYRLARVLWIHYLSKVYEFADTAIMVLKKNERQISFLHVYHHASTFFPCW